MEKLFKPNTAIIVMLAMLLGCYVQNTRANDEIYSVELASNSPVKDVSLKNTALSIAVYSNGIPMGYFDVTTDSNQSFSLTKPFNPPIGIEVLSVKNDSKAACDGAGSPGDTKIKVSCSKTLQ